MREDREFYIRLLNQNGGGLGNGCGTTMMYCVIFFIVLMCFVSCKTITSAESYKENNTEIKKDSADVSVSHGDTTKIEHSTKEKEKEKTHTESHTQKKDSVVTVVDQNGNVIGKKEYHWLRETLREKSEREKILEDSLGIFRHLSDSVCHYKAMYDSISNIAQKEKIVEVEKGQSLRQRISTFFADAIIGVIIFVLVFMLIRLIIGRLQR